ncbi:PREDICTED: uncharacterized protein LOC109346742 isoform X2 [Lupinus angustifolius]|uniref:uncharacterized protein LOC109346742 isoform X2 n=1 Tax=Lupinus angustifolius TaxID=3871 RepID=UPI00092F483A|nr:PREDICTED: uncharacterized protein LOC109346742 isoform X2 [Lupinus angustifolius]
MTAFNLTRVTLSKVSKPPTVFLFFCNSILIHFFSNFSFHSNTQQNITVIEEMEKKSRLGVRKTTLIKPRSSVRKPLLTKFADYLTSQTFMYAPLLSPLPNNFHFPSKVVELNKPLEEKRLFMEQVVEYLISDDYMYAPLLHLSHFPQEPLQHGGPIEIDDSPRRLTKKVNQQTNHLGNVNQRSENHLPQKDLSDQHTRDPKETVKHTVYHICHSTSASRNVTLYSQLRAHG